MQKRALRRLLTAAGLLLVAVFAWRELRGVGPAADEDDAMAFNRVWVEKRPDKHTDYVHVMLLFDRSHFGLFERASSYDLRLEFAEFTREKSTVKLVFPQTGAKKDFTVKVTRCDSLPPFDLCLDVNENPWGGPRRYYGFTDPENERKELGGIAADARARVAAAVAIAAE
jgi:hypothetical protein